LSSSNLRSEVGATIDIMSKAFNK